MAWVPASSYRHGPGWQGRVFCSVPARPPRCRLLPPHAHQHAAGLEQPAPNAMEARGVVMPGNELQIQPDDSCQASPVQDTVTQQIVDPTSLSPTMQRWRSFMGPRFRKRHERPEFLKNYPMPDKTVFNINSMLGKKDVHVGKYYVPPNLYSKFLSQYYQAYQQGYQLYLAECYGSHPFRYFLELDFDWETDEQIVKESFFRLYRLIKSVLQEFYKLQRQPMLMVSMRTPWKVHLNAPNIVTTESQATLCRDKIIQRCREELGAYSSHLDWERVIDFPHGSFRLLGSLKRNDMTLGEPPWVTTKNYHPVTWSTAHGEWLPVQLTQDILMKCSIIPTAQQRIKFENSQEYLNIIFEDAQLHLQKAKERRAQRLAALEAQIQNIRDTSGTDLEQVAESLGGHVERLQNSNEGDEGSQRSQQQHPQRHDENNMSDRHVRPADDAAASLKQHAQPGQQPLGIDEDDRTLNSRLKSVGIQNADIKRQRGLLLLALAKRSDDGGQEYIKLTEDIDSIQNLYRPLQMRWFELDAAHKAAKQQQQMCDEGLAEEHARLKAQIAELQRKASALMIQREKCEQRLIEAADSFLPEHVRAVLIVHKYPPRSTERKDKKGRWSRQKDETVSSNGSGAESLDAEGTSPLQQQEQQLLH